MLDITATLVKNKFVGKRKLVFFTVGALNLKTTIDKQFDYIDKNIILDWYHVSKAISRHVSSSISDNKDEKKELYETINSKFWECDIQGARKIIEDLKVQGKVKSDALKSYIERKHAFMTCYALRKDEGLQNSSAMVEKANDLLVAQRQKNRGMSWTKIGSNTLSRVNQIIRTGRLNQFLQGQKLSSTHALQMKEQDFPQQNMSVCRIFSIVGQSWAKLSARTVTKFNQQSLLVKLLFE